MPKIADLSKPELMNLIYNNFGGKTVYQNHNCYCVSCGKGQDDKPYTYTDHWGVEQKPEPYGYICDQCEANFEADET